jgi:hypothetical protein
LLTKKFFINKKPQLALGGIGVKKETVTVPTPSREGYVVVMMLVGLLAYLTFALVFPRRRTDRSDIVSSNLYENYSCGAASDLSDKNRFTEFPSARLD